MHKAWKELVVAATGGLLVGGCSGPLTQRAPLPLPSSTPSTAPVTPQPVLAAAIAPPTSTTTQTIQTYLKQLAQEGAVSQTQGVWIQTGNQLLANYQGTTPLPAASITKVATSLAALQTLGPNHRFTTLISATGPVKNGVLQGDLVIQGGQDPFFVWEDAIALGNWLQQRGIQRVSGNLNIAGPFFMNFESDPVISGQLLRQGLDESLWPSEAITQYQTLPPDTPRPQVRIEGKVQAMAATPAPSLPLARHQSLPLVELLKRMNRYSNNPMAEMLADRVGGPQVVAVQAAEAAGVPVAEIQLTNGSGLAVENKISPRAACGMFLAIDRLLKPHNMTVADVFTVIGRDRGILDQRPLPASAVVKSGTLDTVSALAGALPTRDRGVVWFAVLNSEGNVDAFRAGQEALLQTLIRQWGAVGVVPSELQPTVAPIRQQTQFEGLS